MFNILTSYKTQKNRIIISVFVGFLYEKLFFAHIVLPGGINIFFPFIKMFLTSKFRELLLFSDHCNRLCVLALLLNYTITFYKLVRELLYSSTLPCYIPYFVTRRNLDLLHPNCFQCLLQTANEIF